MTSPPFAPAAGPTPAASPGAAVGPATTPSVTVIPAVDLLGGRFVRLRQGDPAVPTVERPDAVAVALDYARAGARRLHLVNLGAALGRAEKDAGIATLREVVSRCGLPVQYGGGLRTMDDLREALEAGASWVITGTAALASPGFLGDAVAVFGDRLILAIDVRDGCLLVRGWQERSGLTAAEAVAAAQRAGVKTVMVTDAGGDGTLAGLQPAAFAPFLGQGLEIIAAGGAKGLADIAMLSAWGAGRGLMGIVVGSALVGGGFTLADAQMAVDAAVGAGAEMAGSTVGAGVGVGTE